MVDFACGALFDLDGTLIDTYQPHWRSWSLTCREYGVELEESIFAKSFGRRNPEVIPIYWTSAGKVPPHESSFNAIASRKEQIYRERVEDDFPIFEGCLNFLDDLLAHGVRLAIGTSAPPENVAQALRHLGPMRFQAVVDASQVKEGKPAPDVYLEAARRLKLGIHQCAVFEDAEVGLQAARRAGARRIAFQPLQTPPLSAQICFHAWKQWTASKFVDWMKNDVSESKEAPWIR